MFGWIGLCWKWWSDHWLRFQAIATPIGSLLVTLILTQYWGGDLRNGQPHLEALANFASIGILFYTVFFATLELGVMLVVLAWKVKEYFDNKQMERGIALALEANRQKRSGESLEEAVERLKAAGWKPIKS